MPSKFGYPQIEERVSKITGYMGSNQQREFMFNLARCSMVAAEVGTWKGLSAAIVGLGMADHGGLYYCIDNYKSTNAELVKHENTLEEFLTMRKNLHLERVLLPVVGWSTEVCDQVPNDLDFVYIDGDHEPQSVYMDSKLYVPKLRPYGLALYHDHPWESVRAGIKMAVDEGLIKRVNVIDDFGIFIKA